MDQFSDLLSGQNALFLDLFFHLLEILSEESLEGNILFQSNNSLFENKLLIYSLYLHSIRLYRVISSIY